ncbi:MAG: hypothetical protein ACE5E0_05945 [Terriglobia bacterium]
MSRTFAIDTEKAWDFLCSPAGTAVWLQADGDFEPYKDSKFKTRDGAHGAVTTVGPHHVRLQWTRDHCADHSILQLRATARGPGRTTVTFHHEKLPTETDRTTLRSHWKEALEKIA